MWLERGRCSSLVCWPSEDLNVLPAFWILLGMDYTSNFNSWKCHLFWLPQKVRQHRHMTWAQWIGCLQPRFYIYRKWYIKAGTLKNISFQKQQRWWHHVACRKVADPSRVVLSPKSRLRANCVISTSYSNQHSAIAVSLQRSPWFWLCSLLCFCPFSEAPSNPQPLPQLCSFHPPRWVFLFHW